MTETSLYAIRCDSIRFLVLWLALLNLPIQRHLLLELPWRAIAVLQFWVFRAHACIGWHALRQKHIARDHRPFAHDRFTTQNARPGINRHFVFKRGVAFRA